MSNVQKGTEDAEELNLSGSELMEKLINNKDLEGMVEVLKEEPRRIKGLIEKINTDKGSGKFFLEKSIRLLSEREPSLIYPYFSEIAELIQSPNNFIKWGAMITISNLIAFDEENRFEPLFEGYFSLLNSDSMITAGNVASNAWKFAMQNPIWESEITERLLKVKGNTYLYKGEPSPECKNIMLGHVLGCFDQYYEHSTLQGKMIAFAESEVSNPRKSVARKAKAFLKNHRKSEESKLFDN